MCRAVGRVVFCASSLDWVKTTVLGSRMATSRGVYSGLRHCSRTLTVSIIVAVELARWLRGFLGNQIAGISGEMYLPCGIPVIIEVGKVRRRLDIEAGT